MHKQELTFADSISLLEKSNDISVQFPNDVGDFPVLIEANNCENSIKWFCDNSSAINQILLKYGAVLFRGFNIGSPESFEEHFRSLVGDPIEYKNRTSPRNEVVGNVYTSTSHPSDQVIHMHTESSYSTVYNRIIAFFCLVPPTVGGETPIADERKLLQFLSDSTIKKFKEKGVKYLRNTMPGVGLHWTTVYQTNDKDEVNRILTEQGSKFEWLAKDHLRLEWVLPAFQEHPVLKEEMWFNHMYFGHKSLFDPVVVEYLGEENLPFVTYFGDGSEIDDATIQEFKDFYEQHSIIFKWQKNDLLLLDNMMFSHGRNAYKGERTILTAMSQPYKFG